MHAFHPVFTIAIPFSAALARRPWIAYNAASSPAKRSHVTPILIFLYTGSHQIHQDSCALHGQGLA